MSVKLMSQVWELELPRTDKLVLLALADHAHDDGTSARPGVAYLEWKTDIEERTVRRCLRRLEASGLIDPVKYLSGGYGHTTEFSLHLEKGGRKSPFKKKKGDIGDAQRGTSVLEKGGSGVPPTKGEPSVEPSSTRNELWDAVFEACRIDSNALTKTERGDVGKTVAELLAIGAEPRQVKAKAGEWRKRYPSAPVTHRVLRGHWGELSSNGARREPEPEPPPIDEEGQAKLRTLVDSLAASKRV